MWLHMCVVYNLNNTAHKLQFIASYLLFWYSDFEIIYAFPPTFCLFFLALIVRAANMPADYDSDDEYLAPRPFRQPLINRQFPTVTGAPVASNINQRPIRSDAWSTRMRENYGLDTSEFAYNSSDPNNRQHRATTPAEERAGCSIL
ncbi:hypothetical protein ZOSMA_61G00040 [Zostera marina]|uniref:Tobamovirus multiplication protein 2A n=1 Tax=Zostera marina TaxID=29655 RepID=A0A0K9NTR9_ZOSMR|nr:hypothetical protein ZOSMA_61G00040 [Zostera marina]